MVVALVLTGASTSMVKVQEQRVDEVPGAGVPRVSSLVVHATDVVNSVTDTAVLSDTLRRELVHRLLAGRDWESEYFQRAAERDSFAGDVAQLMETATWQDATLDQTPELVEVQTVIDEFHGWLAGNDHIERGQLLTTALDYLEDPEYRDVVVDVDIAVPGPLVGSLGHTERWVPNANGPFPRDRRARGDGGERVDSSPVAR
jgi:hypothetical protein